jgi:hypothetical protein
MIIRLRETIAPATAPDGSTANPLGATAKLKKTAAPSHNPSSKSLVFERNFIALKQAFIMRFFGEKGKSARELNTQN